MDLGNMRGFRFERVYNVIINADRTMVNKRFWPCIYVVLKASTA